MAASAVEEECPRNAAQKLAEAEACQNARRLRAESLALSSSSSSFPSPLLLLRFLSVDICLVSALPRDLEIRLAPSGPRPFLALSPPAPPPDQTFIPDARRI